jgi:hypothetical protein
LVHVVPFKFTVIETIAKTKLGIADSRKMPLEAESRIPRFSTKNPLKAVKTGRLKSPKRGN